MIEPPLLEVTVDRRLAQLAFLGIDQSIRGLDTLSLEDLDCAYGGDVAPLLVHGANLQRGDHFAIAHHLRLGEHPGYPMIGASQCLGPVELFELSIQRALGDAVQVGGLTHDVTTFPRTRRQWIQPPAQIDQHLHGKAFAAHAALSSRRCPISLTVPSPLT